MNDKKNVGSDITLEINANLSPQQFAKALTSFYSFVENVQNQVSPDKPVKMTVQVKEGSNLIEYHSKDNSHTVHPKTIDCIREELKQLDTTSTSTRYSTVLNSRALYHLNVLCQIVPSYQKYDLPIKAWLNAEKIPITYNIKQNVRQAIQSAFKEYGTIEGRLQGLNSHSGYEINIYEPLHGKKIKCVSEDSELFGKAYRLFGQLVEAEGKIQYDERGIPKEILVEKFNQLKEENELPSYLETKGILKKYV